MRIFVAIPAALEMQAVVERWQREQRGLPPVRWIAGRNLHITLVPPWEESDIERVAAVLAGVEAAPFEVRFSRAESGPDRGAPRLIWATGETPPALLQLRDAVAGALGIEPERRAYRLHMTLARYRSMPPGQVPPRVPPRPIDWRMPVVSFVLYASHLLPGGAEYEVLREVRLGRRG
jgi:2'-5' RNA ligase